MALRVHGANPNRKYAVRAAQRARGGEPRYRLEDVEETMRRALAAAGIERYTMHRSQPPGAEDVNYGISVEFRKPDRVSEAHSARGRSAGHLSE